jgi:hypothetical protein
MTPGLVETERRLVWIFGSPRSGSTWLMALLGAGGDVRTVNEPGIGVHLGAMLDSLVPVEPYGRPSVYRLDQFRRETEDYFFFAHAEQVWGPALRAMILERFRAQLADHRYAVIKEPHGSQAAELLMSLLPRSRLIFLLRDGRDVIDSILDAVATNGWLIGLLEGFRAGDRAAAIRSQAYLWLWRTETVMRAFDAHPEELRMLVRYEELRRDPSAIVTGLAEWLDLEPGPMLKLAQRTAVDRLPKGRGQFVREATPGAWRTGLTRAEQAMVEEILGEKLVELGYPAR